MSKVLSKEALEPRQQDDRLRPGDVNEPAWTLGPAVTVEGAPRALECVKPPCASGERAEDRLRTEERVGRSVGSWTGWIAAKTGEQCETRGVAHPRK